MPASEVMHKFSQGKLHSGSKKGPKVKSRSQAIAIMMSEKRKGSKYHASGSGPFSQSEINKGYKVEFTANDLAKLDEDTEDMDMMMARRRKPPKHME